MIIIKKPKQEKAEIGVLLDANVFFAAAKDNAWAQEILGTIEENYFSKRPVFAFYATNHVIKELKEIPIEIERIVANYVNRIYVTSIDDVINKLSNGASHADKSLIQAFVTNPEIKVLVTDDRDLWNWEVIDLIKANYDKPVHIYNQSRFVQKFLRYRVNHSGLDEAEAYLRTKGILTEEEDE